MRNSVSIGNRSEVVQNEGDSGQQDLLEIPRCQTMPELADGYPGILRQMESRINNSVAANRTCRDGNSLDRRQIGLRVSASANSGTQRMLQALSLAWNSEPPHPVLQGGTLQAQSGGGTLGSSDSPMSFFENSQNL